MSKIVVLSTLYLNIPSANGICARNLVDELRKLGHDVNIVCFEDGIALGKKTESLFTIRNPLLSESHSFIQKVTNLLSAIIGDTRSIINFNLRDEYYKQICAIGETGNIDAIIAMHFPLESVEAMRQYAAKHPSIKTIVFELDSVGDGVSHSYSQRIYKNVYNKWFEKVYEVVSSVIIMESHKEYWLKHFGKKYNCKMSVADIPVLIDKQTSKSKGTRFPIKLIYSGLIEKRYRSPSYLLSLLKHLDGIIDFEFYFYSKGDCEEEISNAAKSIFGLKQFGYVSPEELDKVTSECSILISIGNSFSRSVPSKLISYLGYGKPIIHFSSQENDICNMYLQKYPLALVVDQSKSIEENSEVIIQFIRENIEKRIEIDDIKEIFEKNDPVYSAKIIDNCIKEKL